MIRKISYSHRGFDSTRELRDRLRRDVKGVKYDTIVGMGISGAIVVPTLGRALGKHWGLIRKTGVTCHAYDPNYEGTLGERILIADDGVASGKTVALIIDRLREVWLTHGRSIDPRPVILGVWQYQPSMGSHEHSSWLTMSYLRTANQRIDDAMARYES